MISYGAEMAAGEVEMPEICRFLGIVISMYFDEHNPPHFHVRYNEYRAVLAIRTLNLLDGLYQPVFGGLWRNGRNYTSRSC